MTLIDSFVKMLEDKGYGISGQNIFKWQLPSTLKVDTDVLWIIPSGGTPIQRNKTGELIKSYNFMIYYRNKSARKVAQVMDELETLLNCGAQCVNLEGFETIEISATTLPSDQDRNAEDTMVGMINCQINTYTNCK